MLNLEKERTRNIEKKENGYVANTGIIIETLE